MHDVQRVQLESLASLSRILSASAKNIADIMQQLESEVGTLKTEWTGEAASAYASAQSRWTDQLTAMDALLASSAHAVSGARSAYSSAEAGFAKQL